jgi:integrase
VDRSGTGPPPRLPWAARTGSCRSRSWLPTWACRRRRSTAAGGNGAFGGTASAGTCGSASGTWRSGSGTGRHNHHGQHHQKRCGCPDDDWDSCPHPWTVRYRTTGGRSSRQREQSFGGDLREAGDFALKVEHDKKARVFIDPNAGRATFRGEAEAWLGHHLGADSSITAYDSVLRNHVYPAIGTRPIGNIRREDIRALLAAMRRKGLSASRIGTARLVICAVFNEAVRNRKLAESPCTGIQVPGVVMAKDFILPASAEVEALAAGLPADWAATIWLMHGCGLRIGEALAVRTRCRINDGKTLRVREQVSPVAQLKPLKSRLAGEFRDIPLPGYVAEAIDKHIAGHGTTPDGYLFQGRRHKLVIRRSYQEDFERAAALAGLPTEFTPHSLRHCYASTALAESIPITEVSRWLGHRNIEITHQIYGHLVPASWDRARTILDNARNASTQGQARESAC